MQEKRNFHSAFYFRIRVRYRGDQLFNIYVFELILKWRVTTLILITTNRLLPKGAKLYKSCTLYANLPKGLGFLL